MTKQQAYKTGAMLGGTIGFITAIILKRRLWLWAAAFAVGGGYIGYTLVENTETAPVIKNPDAEPEKENKKI